MALVREGLLLIAVGSAAVAAASPGDIVRVSTNALGVQGNHRSVLPRISANGRYVSFGSDADNLVAGDTNGYMDVFRKDLQTGQIVRVSTDALGVQGSNTSEWPSIGADGRYVAFASRADNLVPGDTNGYADVFRKDLQTGQIVRVSTDAVGSQGNEWSYLPSISAEGRYLAFISYSDNLVPADTNGELDVFRKDLQTGQIVRVSTDALGIQGNSSSEFPSISADGRYVAFSSLSTNLVPAETNTHRKVFRKDLQTGQIVRVTTDALGIQGNNYSHWPSISADGRYVAFYSYSDNLVLSNGNQHIFRKDLQTGQLVIASTDAFGAQGNDGSGNPSISADGRYVAFETLANNLVPEDTNGTYDVFRKDLQTGQIVRVSTDAVGAQGNDRSRLPSISADGRYVAFDSAAENLVPGDTNGAGDAFRKELSIGPWSSSLTSANFIRPVGTNRTRTIELVLRFSKPLAEASAIATFPASCGVLAPPEFALVRTRLTEARLLIPVIGSLRPGAYLWLDLEIMGQSRRVSLKI